MRLQRVKRNKEKGSGQAEEKEDKAIKRREPREKPEKVETVTQKRAPMPKPPKPPSTAIHDTVNTDIIVAFQTALHMLEETLRAGKLNPAQGLLGMMMIADLFHGGAYTVPINERPALVGNNSPYWGGKLVGAADFYPIPGVTFNFFSIFNWGDFANAQITVDQAHAETAMGQAIAQEVYLNGNVPHKFPKIISDEVYAKILVMAQYMSHSALVLTNATGVKTFVEAESKLLGAETKMVTEPMKAIKNLTPLLSLLQGAE
jgi:hypothetical protein